MVIDDISIQPIGAFFKKKRNIYCKTAGFVVKFKCYMPVCWNWQTRRIQNPLVAIPCGFDPRHRHHKAKPLPEGEGLSIYESNGTGVEPIRRPRHRHHKAKPLPEGEGLSIYESNGTGVEPIRRPRHRHHKAKPLPEGEGLSIYESNGTGVEPIRRPRHRHHKAKPLPKGSGFRFMKVTVRGRTHSTFPPPSP